MKEIYKKILDKAIDYYGAGDRKEAHVKWLVKIIPRFVKESEVDFDILIPLAILHDIGYAKVPKGSDPYDPKIRKMHTEEGAKISEKILLELSYNKYKIKEIKRLVSKHDDWSFGDNFSREPILGIFNNFDFIWMASEEGFRSAMQYLHKNPKQMFEHIKKCEAYNNGIGLKYFNNKIENYYNKLIKEREKELSET
jgi:hypothetical protein